MPDYSKGKIYTIRSHNDDKLIYVGSTIQPLSTRFGGHKRDQKNKTSLSKYINNPENNTDWYQWYIELYENYPCNSKDELCKRENEIIREIATINQRGYYVDKKEWSKEYRSKNKEKISEYNDENRDKIAATHKEYQAKNHDKIAAYKKEYRAENNDTFVAKDKEYYAQNRDKIIAKQKEYYTENRDKFLAYKKEWYAKKKALTNPS
jgi:hypothetical protein